jgi:hypothetical protein
MLTCHLCRRMAGWKRPPVLELQQAATGRQSSQTGSDMQSSRAIIWLCKGCGPVASHSGRQPVRHPATVKALSAHARLCGQRTRWMNPLASLRTKRLGEVSFGIPAAAQLLGLLPLGGVWTRAACQIRGDGSLEQT